MNLVPEAKKWYRLFSVQALIIIGAVQSILIVLSPATLGGHIPFLAAYTWQDAVAVMTIIAAVLGAVGRLIDQGAVTDPNTP